MPRLVTLGQLKTRASRLANLAGSGFTSPSEQTDLANAHISEVLAELSEAGPPEYNLKSFQITTSAGTFSYPLTTYVADFGYLANVYALESTDASGVAMRRPLRSINAKERIAYGAPGGAVTVEIEYTPLPPTLVGDGDTFDGLWGYDELVVCLMARDMCIKQRQDFAGIQTKIGELRARIQKEADNRDRGQPRHIADVEDVYRHWYLPGSVGIRAYRLIGDSIELYQPSMIWW